MKCVICRNGETQDQHVTVTLESNGKTFIFKEVPAQVCMNCGEEYVDEKTSARLFALAKSAAQSGTELTVARYNVA